MLIYNGELEKKLYKDVIGETIAKIAYEDKDVYHLDCDLMSSGGTHKLWTSSKSDAEGVSTTNRIINCGISEANMVGVAAGLSLMGKKVYGHTFGPFASRRCYDQLFLSIGYSGASFRLIGSDPGVTAAYNGGTHMPFEDIALIRAIPHSTVIEISTGGMLEQVLRACKDYEGLTYIRTSRKSYPAIYSDDTKFEICKGMQLTEGADVTIVACGLLVSESLAAEKLLAEKGISATVIDMFTIKPLDTELLLKAVKKTGAVVTCENHNLIGGLADAVGAALLENNLSVPFGKIGIYESFGEVGPLEFLQRRFRLTANDIVDEVMLTLAKK